MRPIEDVQSQLTALNVGWLTRSQLNDEAIAETLEPDEVLGYAVQAKYEGKTVMLIATDRHLLGFFINPKALQFKFAYADSVFVHRKQHFSSSELKLLVKGQYIILMNVLDLNAKPTLGEYIQDKLTDAATASVETPLHAHCPRCGSEQLTANQKGFGLGKAAAGAVLLGPVGLLGGFVGSGKVQVTCLRCGHSWKPGKQ